MRADEIRAKFLKYFEERGHTVVPSSSLVPEGDPTLLFTNAGMVQFKGVFLDEEGRPYSRAVSVQKCVRAGGKHNDLENVGVTARHHTFFEMLGNFSFGDYFKEGAIEYAWDFLVRVMGLPEKKLWVTVYEDDDEAEELWQGVAGVSPSRIVRMGEADNFWSMGETGPCGPCSEILIDQGPDVGCLDPGCRVGCECDRYLELWNLVFMQYDRDARGELAPLPRQCIDTGLGLERLSAVMQGRHTNYECDLFMPLIEEVEGLCGKRYGEDPERDVSIRAVADHARAATFLIADGVLPSNEGRGYVLRRIIRRAARHGRFLGLTEPFLHEVNGRVIGLMGRAYPEIETASGLVKKATCAEERQFFETLERGLSLLEEEVGRLKEGKTKVMPGEVVFRLYDTYGFPADLTADILKRDGLTVDEEGFERCMEVQRSTARRSWKGTDSGAAGAGVYAEIASGGAATEFTGYESEVSESVVTAIVRDAQSVESASEGETVGIVTRQTPFYAESGGQVGDTGSITAEGFSAVVTDTQRPADGVIVHICRVERGSVTRGAAVRLAPDMARRRATARNHTATHILHALLRKTVGVHVRQAGSHVSASGLRFDFNHFEPLTEEQARSIEAGANAVVLDDIEVTTEILPYKAALERGALAFFGDKYGDEVRMVSIPPVSAELCGGTHVSRTGEIGLIRITSEASVASGVRRLEALTGTAAYEAAVHGDRLLKGCASLLRTTPDEMPARIKKLLESHKKLEREAAALRGRGKAGEAAGLAEKVRTVAGLKVVAARVECADAKALREMADTLRDRLKSVIVVLGAPSDGKAVLLAAVTKDLSKKFSAGVLVKRLAPLIGGKGGGRPELAQAGGRDPGGIDNAIEAALVAVEEMAGG